MSLLASHLDPVIAEMVTKREPKCQCFREKKNKRFTLSLMLNWIRLQNNKLVLLAVLGNRQRGKCFRSSIFQARAKEKLGFDFVFLILAFYFHPLSSRGLELGIVYL